MNELTFAELRTANVKRCSEGFKHPLDSWSVAEWGNAAGGELGEAFETMLIALAAGAVLGKAQNTAKKILRFRDGVAGNKKSREEYLKDLASEIAGTLIYLDLWAASEGLDTAQIVRDEFNKSRMNSDIPKGSKAMAGRKRTVKPDQSNPANEAMLAALQFIEPASSEVGPPNATHCLIANKRVHLFNGTMGLGCPIDLDIVAAPNLKLLLAALKRCKKETQITQLDNERLSVKSGPFTANVPCLDPALLMPIEFTQPIAPADDKLKVSIEAVAKLAKENADRVLAASVLFRNGSCVTINSSVTVIMEHWHGISMPEIIMPKLSAMTLAKCTKKLESFAIAQDPMNNNAITSITFYFEGGYWFRSQLYVEKFPEKLDAVLGIEAKPWPIPEGLWAAIEAIEPFTEQDDRIFLGQKTVKTAQFGVNGTGATYEIAGTLPAEPITIKREYLMMMQLHAKTVDWNASETIAAFYGENFRSMIAKIKSSN